MDEHELISGIKQLASELGRTPTRLEYVNSGKGTRSQYLKVFGSFSQLVVAAGLELHPQNSKKQRIDSSVFTKQIDQHIENHKPLPYQLRKLPSALIISDIHWPFSCERVIKSFLISVERIKPEFVILNGDAWDMYSHSKFPRSHNLFTSKDEEIMCRNMNEEFWQKVQQLSPKSKCVQMIGNHDLRPMKRILEAYPEAADWVEEKLNKLFTFDCVKTIYDPREEFYLGDDVAVFHGYRTGLGAHRDYTLMCTVNGHSHVGGVSFKLVQRNRKQIVIWELNSGYAGDPTAKGLTYTPQKIIHWTPGFAEIDSYGPRFIPA